MTVYSMEIYKKKEKHNLKYCIKYFVPVIGKKYSKTRVAAKQHFQNFAKHENENFGSHPKQDCSYAIM